LQKNTYLLLQKKSADSLELLNKIKARKKLEGDIELHETQARYMLCAKARVDARQKQKELKVAMESQAAAKTKLKEVKGCLQGYEEAKVMPVKLLNQNKAVLQATAKAKLRVEGIDEAIENVARDIRAHDDKSMTREKR
jgi:hypothetical protein